MPRSNDPSGPRGLIRESFRIEGIQASECRSIFLDWAIGVPIGEDSCSLIRRLIGKYGADYPDHPMIQVLNEALNAPPPKKRRGGAAARRKSD